ncbi:MAG TPA: hypothetical protein VNZ56_10320 [Verrucomicrobiae bacterium]|nr:hypothetical protein [Verrucomicrobiae bacterium]
MQNWQLQKSNAWHARCPSIHNMSFHCLLAVLSLCGMLRDRPVMALAGMHAAVATWDGIETRQGLNSGWAEADPLSRPFVHDNAAMIAAGAVEVTAFAVVANNMRHSPHRALRDTWFVWQTVPIAAHVVSAAAWVRARQTNPNRSPIL